MNMERIYIGGMEPPRLTVDDVLQRLERINATLAPTVPVQIHTHDLHKGTCYCQFSAMATDSSSSASSLSALEILKKHFHHVVWKGCKLRVEPARLHLLDRLAQERKERTKQQQQQNEEREQQTQAAALTTSTTTTTPPTTRYLRIRKRFRQEAQKVDTKPYLLQDWESFERIAIKMKQKRLEMENRQQQQQRKQQKGPKQQHDGSLGVTVAVAPLARALHLRFPSSSKSPEEEEKELADKDGAKTTNNNTLHSSLLVDDSDSDSGTSTFKSLDDKEMSSTGSNRSSSTTGSRRESSHELRKQQQAGTYVWSLDDDDDDDDDDESCSSSSSRSCSSSEASVSPTESRIRSPPLLPTKKKQESFDSVEQATDDGILKQDDRRSGASSSSSSTSSRSRGTNSNGGADDGRDDAAFGVVDHVDDDGDLNLKLDVASNLQILSQLFPAGVIDTTPVQVMVMSDDNDSKNNNNYGGGNNYKNNGNRPTVAVGTSTVGPYHERCGSGAASGWGSTGQMLRYDPKHNRTAVEAFLVRREQESGGDGVDNDDEEADVDTKMTSCIATTKGVADATTTAMIASDDSQHQHTATNENNIIASNSNEQHRHIYHQDKLEAVFREAREEIPMTTTTETTSTRTSIQDISKASKEDGGVAQNKNGNFTFSFHIVENEKEKTDDNSSFAFYATAGDDEAAVVVDSTVDVQRDDDNDVGLEADEQGEAEHEHDRESLPKRRFGRAFTDEELDSYILNDFLMADYCKGDRIFNNPDGWRKDESLKAQWAKERAILTQDWKRKRKAAVARKNHQKR